jgi:hypothetical protein
VETEFIAGRRRRLAGDHLPAGLLSMAQPKSWFRHAWLGALGTTDLFDQ